MNATTVPISRIKSSIVCSINKNKIHIFSKPSTTPTPTRMDKIDVVHFLPALRPAKRGSPNTRNRQTESLCWSTRLIAYRIICMQAYHRRQQPPVLIDICAYSMDFTHTTHVIGEWLASVLMLGENLANTNSNKRHSEQVCYYSFSLKLLV